MKMQDIVDILFLLHCFVKSRSTIHVFLSEFLNKITTLYVYIVITLVQLQSDWTYSSRHQILTSYRVFKPLGRHPPEKVQNRVILGISRHVKLEQIRLRIAIMAEQESRLHIKCNICII